MAVGRELEASGVAISNQIVERELEPVRMSRTRDMATESDYR
jgi:hypothetical protein